MVQINTVKPDFDKPSPGLGVKTVAFSSTGSYLATLNDNMPNAVWVWDTRGMSAACVLLHERPVKHISWDPSSDRLGICTAAKRYRTTSAFRFTRSIGQLTPNIIVFILSTIEFIG